MSETSETTLDFSDASLTIKSVITATTLTVTAALTKAGVSKSDIEF